MKHLIQVPLAGLCFPCELRYPQGAKCFPQADPSADPMIRPPVRLSEEDWKTFIDSGMQPCARTEFSALTAAFSDALMEYDRMILHAVAVRWRDRAWLFCAPSGVGKSTQAKYLQALRPGEFSIICGDRPVLEFRHSERSEESAPQNTCHSERSAAEPKNPSPPLTGSPGGPFQNSEAGILVHPSPWNGKENWHGAEAAPLGGIIVLSRGEENKVEPIRKRDAVIPVFAQVIQTCTKRETILKSAELTTRLLNGAPLWRMVSAEVPDSTKLLLETVFL